MCYFYKGVSFVTVFYSLVFDFSVVVGVLVLDELSYFSAKGRLEALCK